MYDFDDLGINWGLLFEYFFFTISVGAWLNIFFRISHEDLGQGAFRLGGWFLRGVGFSFFGRGITGLEVASRHTAMNTKACLAKCCGFGSLVVLSGMDMEIEWELLLWLILGGLSRNRLYH